MKFIVLSCLILVSLAGEACLPKGWVLKWVFPDEETIEFSLEIDADTWDNYGWVGIGFKYPDDASAMIGADINNFILNELPTDRYAVINGLPSLDIDIGGTNDISDASLDGYTYTWKRPVNSGDEFDKVYIKNDPMRVLWACGQVDGVVQKKHDGDDRDTLDIVLSDDFEISCDEAFIQLI